MLAISLRNLSNLLTHGTPRLYARDADNCLECRYTQINSRKRARCSSLREKYRGYAHGDISYAWVCNCQALPQTDKRFVTRAKADYLPSIPTIFLPTSANCINSIKKY